MKIFEYIRNMSMLQRFWMELIMIVHETQLKLQASRIIKSKNMRTSNSWTAQLQRYNSLLKAHNQQKVTWIQVKIARDV